MATKIPKKQERHPKALPEIKTSNKPERQIKFPLYYGWEIVLSLRNLGSAAEQIIGPFSTYKRYMVAVVAAILLVSTVLLLTLHGTIDAATYTWQQTDWSGGATANTATHASDRTGWNEYESKDVNISAGADVALATTTTTITDTSDTDFNAGTFNGTAVTGIGAAASLELALEPSEINISGLAADARDIKIVGDYAYVADGTAGLKIINISDPSNMTLTGSTGISIGEAFYEIEVVGDYAYLAAGIGGYQIYDVSNPASPFYWDRASYSTYRAYALEHIGNYMYVAFSYDPDGLGADGVIRNYQINITPTNTSATSTATRANTGFQYGMTHLGNTLYTSGHMDNGFQDLGMINTWDISTANTTWLFSRLSNGDNSEGRDVVVYQQGPSIYAYVASADGALDIYNVSNPSSIPVALAGTYDPPGGNVWGVAINNDTLFLGAGADGLLKLSLTLTPTAPSLQGTYSLTDAGGTNNVRKIFYNSGTVFIANSTNGIGSITPPGYVSSGNFESAIFNTNGNTAYGIISGLVQYGLGGGSVNFKARTSNDPGMSGATDWTSCATITSGADMSSNNCVTDGEQYLQYYVEITTLDPSQSHTVNLVNLQYLHYPASQTLTSSPYNTEDATNVVGSPMWSESLPAGTEVKMQIRTAPDNSGSPGTWTSFLGPTSTGDYYSNALGGDTVNSAHTDGSDDQWVQYKFWLESNQIATPTISDVSFLYVVNAPPEFQSAPTATQQSDGTVLITYSVRDIDTTAGSVTPGYVTPSFEYSPDGGGNWYAISSGLSAGATTQKSVDESAYSQYQATWTAKSQIDGTYSTNMQIRVTIDDSEGANNTTTSTSSTFTLDVKDPVPGSPALLVDASVSPAALTLSATDDSSLEMTTSLDSGMSSPTWVTYNTSATLALGTNPDTAYVQFKDAYQNTSTIESAVTPEMPSYMILRDISNTSIPYYQLFVSWKAVSTPLAQFDSYEIYSSTDGNSYSLLETITDKSINYYVHGSLVADQAYYYKVKTIDTDGNVSYFSSVVSDEANGQGGTDLTPPTISNVAISNIGTQSAVITWDTDELSNSTVGYSSTPANFDTEIGVATMVDSALGVGQHTITLTDLSPNTTYYVQIKSEDPLGNTSTDNSGGDGYAFTTLAGPAISNVTTQEVLNNSATISWITDQSEDSTVYYSTAPDLSGADSITINTPTTNHSVTITGLTKGTTYYYYVTSGVAFDKNGGNYYSFTTTQDETAPLISSVQANPITDTQGVVQWTTNEKATSQVSYGTTSGSYSKTTTLDSALNITHQQTLSNLGPSTKYYYKVTSQDASGNTATSSEYSFTTFEKLSTEEEVLAREEQARNEALQEVDEIAPSISEVDVSSTTATSTAITWVTNELANSFVQFGPTSTYGNIRGNWEYGTVHSLTLSELLPNTTYHFRVVSADTSGNTTLSADATFTTTDSSTATTADDIADIITKNAQLLSALASGASLSVLEDSLNEQYNLIQQLSKSIPTPFISGEPRVVVTANSAEITWTSDKASNSLIAYAPENTYAAGATEPYSQVVGDAETYDTTHAVTLSNLSPATTYHYQIRSKTAVSQTTKSVDYTFTTDSRAFEIENYAIENVSDQESIFRWTTNVESNSSVKIVPYRNNIRAVEDTVVVTDDFNTNIHQLSYDNFESGIVYDVELISTAPDGTVATRTIDAFTTNNEDTPPIITQIQTDSALSPGKDTKVQTIISWTTNELSTSRVYYRKGVGNADEELTEKTQLDQNYSRNHVVVITTFDVGSVYQFKVESIDSSGNVSLSKPLTILTPQQEQTVFQVIMDAVERSFGWINLF